MELVSYFFGQLFLVPRRSDFGRLFDDLVADLLPWPEFLTYAGLNILILITVFFGIRRIVLERRQLLDFFNLAKNRHHGWFFGALAGLVSLQWLSVLDPFAIIFPKIWQFLLLLQLGVLMLMSVFVIWFVRSHAHFFKRHKRRFALFLVPFLWWFLNGLQLLSLLAEKPSVAASYQWLGFLTLQNASLLFFLILCFAMMMLHFQSQRAEE